MTTTIQDIFEMRKNGQFEEAYKAVLPLYREHHGHYTTLCMFWTATDVCRLRIEQGKIEEAKRIFSALINLHPMLQDKDNSGFWALYRLGSKLNVLQDYPHLIEKCPKKYFVKQDGELVPIHKELVVIGAISTTQPERVKMKFCHLWVGYHGLWAVVQGPQLWPVFNPDGTRCYDKMDKIGCVYDLDDDTQELKYLYKE